MGFNSGFKGLKHMALPELFLWLPIYVVSFQNCSVSPSSGAVFYKRFTSHILAYVNIFPRL